ncbi:MAG: hypothetical protein IKG56_00110 [Clostridia bacterium]|nr:hypothetical protein [Clostridia bacterium]
MKLQHLAVIFIIIILPISMVISTYVNNLIDVSNKEAQYNTVLMNSTYDAVRAYQINTLNNTFASVNASRVRDIQASVNSFFNSLASGLSTGGYSKTELQAYVPAILFTLYDGFYVYGPYSNYANVDTDSGKKNINYGDGTVKEVTEYGLKPYSYYTCEYQRNDSNSYHLIVNFTLDNYISVMGTYHDGGQEKYITASGYYIDARKIVGINEGTRTVTIKGTPDNLIIGPETLGEYIYAYNSKQVENKNGSGNSTINLPVKPRYYRYMNYNEEKYYYDDAMDADDNEEVSLSYLKDSEGKEIEDEDHKIPIFYLDKNLKIYISQNMLQTLANERGCDIEEIRNGTKFQDVNNYKYYKNAYEFSRTDGDVYKALSQIDIGTSGGTGDNRVIRSKYFNNDGTYKVNTESSDGQKTETMHMKYNYGNTAKIFDYTISSGNDPETDSSIFNEHRLDVIISGIESNLASSISNFNKYQYNSAYDFRMPTISESDWDKIANNVNIVAFLQGFAVGNYKFYNNYSVVSDTRNKEFISKEAIYVQKNMANGIVATPPYEGAYEQDKIPYTGENDNNLPISGDQKNLFELYKNNNDNNYYHDPRCGEFHHESDSNVIAYRLIDYEPDSFVHDYDGWGWSNPAKTKKRRTDIKYSEAVNYYMQAGTGGYECIVTRNGEMFSYDDLILGTGEIKLNNGTSVNLNPAVRKAYLSALAREKGAAFKNLQLLRFDTKNINEQLNNP